MSNESNYLPHEDFTNKDEQLTIQQIKEFSHSGKNDVKTEQSFIRFLESIRFCENCDQFTSTKDCPRFGELLN